MPITYEIDHDRKLVRARIAGTLTRDDAFKYQQHVWGLPEVRGYNQLIDASDMGHVDIPFPSADAMRELSSLAASMDDPTLKTRFAIVATSAFAYGLARMYATYRALDPRSTRVVSVFRSVEDAMTWLEAEESQSGK
ncbi:MAG TPA: hypothetical protein VFH33_09200 [Candidatus Krumholzibacteria bacterium]|nr:hypothetical protein [Candidatus Krumholzibacteria bacterium]